MCAVLVPCPQPPPLAAPAPDRPRYVVIVRVPGSFRTVSGRVDVTLTPTRPTFRVVATGVPYGGNRFKARAVRDVALAIGHFRVQSARACAVTVRVASTGLPKQQARTLLTYATHALQTLSTRYGAYPWRSYTLVVPPDLPTVGIEYPMLSFIGHSRFDRLIVNHETAHQWFYSPSTPPA